jgi:hypothetical protein
MAETPDLKARLRRRIPAYLLLVGMIVIVLHFWRKGPSDVDVGYQLGRVAKGLAEASMVYRRAGRAATAERGTKASEELARVRFSFARKAAGRRLEHRVRLPDGDYEVSIVLRYRDQRTVRMRRPLLVRGSGKVTVFVGES